jgi:hypothetical protein
VVPGAPTGFTAKAINHGAQLTWNAPANAGEGTTYKLEGGAARTGITGTSYTVTGLTNNQKYEFTLKAVNAAGAGQNAATASVSLVYPHQQYKNASNNDTRTLIRPTPAANGDTNVGKIPQGQYITLTVICQVKGTKYTDPSTGNSSDVWDKIESQYGNGYLNDTLVATPKGSFPAGGLFECDD